MHVFPHADGLRCQRKCFTRRLFEMSAEVGHIILQQGAVGMAVLKDADRRRFGALRDREHEDTCRSKPTPSIFVITIADDLTLPEKELWKQACSVYAAVFAKASKNFSTSNVVFLERCRQVREAKTALCNGLSAHCDRDIGEFAKQLLVAFPGTAKLRECVLMAERMAAWPTSDVVGFSCLVIDKNEKCGSVQEYVARHLRSTSLIKTLAKLVPEVCDWGSPADSWDMNAVNEVLSFSLDAFVTEGSKDSFTALRWKLCKMAAARAAAYLGEQCLPAFEHAWVVFVVKTSKFLIAKGVLKLDEPISKDYAPHPAYNSHRLVCVMPKMMIKIMIKEW